MSKGGTVDPIETWTRDVSRQGLLVELDQRVKRGSQIHLTLDVPPDVAGTALQLSCLARVMHVVRKGPKYTAGVKIESYQQVTAASPGEPVLTPAKGAPAGSPSPE